MTLYKTITSTAQPTQSVVYVTETRDASGLALPVVPSTVTVTRTETTSVNNYPPQSLLPSSMRGEDMTGQSVVISLPNSALSRLGTGLGPILPTALSGDITTSGGTNLQRPQTTAAMTSDVLNTLRSTVTSMTNLSSSSESVSGARTTMTDKQVSAQRPNELGKSAAGTLSASNGAEGSSSQNLSSSTVSHTLTGIPGDVTASASSKSIVDLHSSNVEVPAAPSTSVELAIPVTSTRTSFTTQGIAGLPSDESCSTRLTTVTNTITSTLYRPSPNGTINTSTARGSNTGAPSTSPDAKPSQCFDSLGSIPEPLIGLALNISIQAVIAQKSCAIETCVEHCLSSAECKSISHSAEQCSLFSIQITLDVGVTVSPASTTKYWNKCTSQPHEKRQLGFLDPILSPLTTALPLAPVVSLVQPIISQIAPITPVLSILEPLTTLAAVVSPVASVLDPIFTVLGPIATPIVSVLEPVESAIRPVLSELDPALSGVVSAVLPAITPIPSLLDPLIPVVRTILSNADVVATNVVEPVASGLSPVASIVVSALDPIVSGIRPVETGLLDPLNSALSPIVGEVTSVLYPLATPLLSGVLSGATLVALPVATPIICDIVASDVEHGLLGLNAGCAKQKPAITGSIFASSNGSAVMSATLKSNLTLASSTSVDLTLLPSTFQTISASAKPCVVTAIVQKYETIFVDRR